MSLGIPAVRVKPARRTRKHRQHRLHTLLSHMLHHHHTPHRSMLPPRHNPTCPHNLPSPTPHFRLKNRVSRHPRPAGRPRHPHCLLSVIKKSHTDKLPKEKLPMTDDQFHARLTDLITQINTLPEDQRKALRLLADETRRRHGELRQTLGRVDHLLAEMRLQTTYLQFDLEATRRENAELKRKLTE